MRWLTEMVMLNYFYSVPDSILEVFRIHSFFFHHCDYFFCGISIPTMNASCANHARLLQGETPLIHIGRRHWGGGSR